MLYKLIFYFLTLSTLLTESPFHFVSSILETEAVLYLSEGIPHSHSVDFSQSEYGGSEKAEDTCEEGSN